MAPRGRPAMKRPAAALPQSVAKRPAKAAGTGMTEPAKDATAMLKWCHEEVAKAVLASTDYPAPVLELLVSNLSVSLGVPKDGRHSYQEEVAGMIGEVLTKVEDSMQASLAEAEAKLGDASAQRAERERVEQVAVQELDARKEATAAAQAAATESGQALLTACQASAAAESAQALRVSELEGLVGQKARLTSSFSNAYIPLKEGTSEPAKAQEDLATLLSVGKDFSFDESMLKALPSAAAKALSSRGPFDSMVIMQLEQEFNKCTSTLTETIANAESAKNEADTTVEGATSAAESAKSDDEKCKTSLEAAKAAEKEALTTKREATKALQQCGPEFKQALAEVNRAKSRLSEFREGPLAAYNSLLERTQPALAKAASAEAAPEAAPDAAPEAAPEALPESDTAQVE